MGGDRPYELLQNYPGIMPLLLTDIFQRFAGAACIEPPFAKDGRRFGVVDQPIRDTGVEVAENAVAVHSVGCTTRGTAMSFRVSLRPR